MTVTLEFAWVGDDAVDPLQQARTLSLLVGAGIKTREEARAELGLAPEPAVGPERRGGGATVAKYNHNHDRRGRFSTPRDAVAPGDGAQSSPKPEGVEVASRDDVPIDTTANESSDSNTQPPPIQVAGDPSEDTPLRPADEAVIDSVEIQTRIQVGLSAEEAKITNTSMNIMGSPFFNELRQEYASGQAIEVNINGYPIIYEPGLPAYISGMTDFGVGGFVMGSRSFSSNEETIKTVLQELYRLNTSKLGGTGYPGGFGSPAHLETEAARSFADRAYEALKNSNR